MEDNTWHELHEQIGVTQTILQDRMVIDPIQELILENQLVTMRVLIKLNDKIRNIPL